MSSKLNFLYDLRYTLLRYRRSGSTSALKRASEDTNMKVVVGDRIQEKAFGSNGLSLSRLHEYSLGRQPFPIAFDPAAVFSILQTAIDLYKDRETPEALYRRYVQACVEDLEEVPPESWRDLDGTGNCWDSRFGVQGHWYRYMLLPNGLGTNVACWTTAGKLLYRLRPGDPGAGTAIDKIFAAVHKSACREPLTFNDDRTEATCPVHGTRHAYSGYRSWCALPIKKEP